MASNGQLLFLSGHVPMRMDGSIAWPKLEDQLEQVFENLLATLQAGGVSFADVARLTIYIRDYRPEQLAIIRRVPDRFIDPERTRQPAR